MAAQPRADPVHQAHRRQAAGEGEELNEQDIQRQEDPKDGPQRGAGRDAEDVRGDQRVAEHSLVSGARGGERGANDERREHPRPAHLQNDRFDVSGKRVRASRQLRNQQGENFGQGNRVAPHCEREGGHAEQRSCRQQIRDGARFTAAGRRGRRAARELGERLGLGGTIANASSSPAVRRVTPARLRGRANSRPCRGESWRMQARADDNTGKT